MQKQKIENVHRLPQSVISEKYYNYSPFRQYVNELKFVVLFNDTRWE